MRHMKYSKPISNWGVGMRMPVTKICASCMKPEYRPKKTAGMRDLRWYQDTFKYKFKSHRNAVGVIRAMGAPHFFRGCYLGAEND